MSAEVENSKEEEEVKVEKSKKPLKKRLQENWPVGIKILELLICAICMGTIYDPISNVEFKRNIGHHIGIMYTAYTGYMLINCVLLLGRALGDRIPYRTMSIFAIMGSALFLVTGILLIVDINAIIISVDSHRTDYRSTRALKRSEIQVSIGFAFINFLAFSVDAVLTFISRIIFALYKRNNPFYAPNMHLTVMLTTSIIFSFINLVAFASDAVYTYVRRKDF